MTTAMHPLDAATALQTIDADRRAGTTSPAYWNFAGPFGGITAAIAMRAVLDDPRRQGSPIAQTVNFCGAIREGAFEVALTLERTGRTTQHWSVRLAQGGSVAMTATIVTAVRAPSFAHTVTKFPTVPPADSVAVNPPPPHLPWLSSYEFRFIEGGPIFNASRPAGDLGSSRTALWMRDRPDRALDFTALSAIADAFILRLVQMRGAGKGPMIPMSTVTLTTYFHASEAELAAQGSAPLLGIADAHRFNENFHDQQMQLWSQAGGLLASGCQTVWYRE